MNGRRAKSKVPTFFLCCMLFMGIELALIELWKKPQTVFLCTHYGFIVKTILLNEQLQTRTPHIVLIFFIHCVFKLKMGQHNLTMTLKHTFNLWGFRSYQKTGHPPKTHTQTNSNINNKTNYLALCKASFPLLEGYLWVVVWGQEVCS